MVIYLKRLKSSRLGRVQAFPMYGGLGMSAPSLHRESTDSLISIFIHNAISGRLAKCSSRVDVPTRQPSHSVCIVDHVYGWE